MVIMAAFLKACFLPMHQKCDPGRVWKYFEVRQNSLEAMIKEELFTK